jgi:fluoride exporter
MPDRSATSPFEVRPRAGRPPPIRRRLGWRVTLVIALGGALGSLARYAVAVAWPTPARGFPWATFVTNVTGCLVIGALMVLISEVWTTHRLVRPFLGVGVVGSFTTFSAYTVETQQLLDAGRAPVALGYLFGTLAAALLAVQLGVVLTRLGARRRVRRGG